LGTLALAGCGGSKSSTTAPAPSTTTATKTATTTTPTTRAQTSTTATTRSTATTSTASINVRVPARFTIGADGAVSPPTVTIPANLPVELIVVSNAKMHRITLRTIAFTIGPHQQVEKLIDGLKAGSYPLKVDGAAKAALTIGGSPGP
jgi:hypothetical protein